MYVDSVIAANMPNLRSPGADDAVEELLGHVYLAVDHAGVGDGVVVVGTEVFDDLLGLLDVGGAVAGDSDTGRRLDVSNLGSGVGEQV